MYLHLIYLDIFLECTICSFRRVQCTDYFVNRLHLLTNALQEHVVTVIDRFIK